MDQYTPSTSSPQDQRLSGIMASVQESAAALGYVVEQVVVRPATTQAQAQQQVQQPEQSQQQQQPPPSQQDTQQMFQSPAQPFTQERLPPMNPEKTYPSQQQYAAGQSPFSIAITPQQKNYLYAQTQQQQFSSPADMGRGQEQQQQQHAAAYQTGQGMSDPQLLHPPHPSEYKYRQMNHLDLQLPPPPAGQALTSPVSPPGTNNSPGDRMTSAPGEVNVHKRFVVPGKREYASSYNESELVGTPELKRTRLLPDVGGFSLGPPEGTRSTRGNRFAPASKQKRAVDGSLIARLRGFSSASGRLQGMPPSPKGDDQMQQQRTPSQLSSDSVDIGVQHRMVDDAAPVTSVMETTTTMRSPSTGFSSPSSPMDIIEGNKQKVVTSAMLSNASLNQGSTSPRGGSHQGQQSPDRPFGCPECSTWFGRKDNLKKHIRMIHLNERPFPCEICGYPFQKKDHLHKHIRTVHQRQRPFACDRCDKTFGQKSDLTKHVRTVHEKQRPYICKVCGLAFGHKGNLMRHIWVVHEKQRPYRCLLCHSEFGEKSNLDKHVRQVHEKHQRRSRFRS